MITEASYIKAANDLGCEVAAIKAVAEVESSGSGFLASGELKILFEPHVFWRELVKEGKDPKQILKDHPELSDVLYEKWGEKPYGLVGTQWDRLRKAGQIDIDSAHKAASYGKFQLMGNNYAMVGYKDIFEMLHHFRKGEEFHLHAFVQFVKSAKLDKFIKNKEWDRFALGYNGRSYKTNRYDEKMKEAYEKFSK